jgi:hypothetical protein
LNQAAKYADNMTRLTIIIGGKFSPFREVYASHPISIAIEAKLSGKYHAHIGGRIYLSEINLSRVKLSHGVNLFVAYCGMIMDSRHDFALETG